MVRHQIPGSLGWNLHWSGDSISIDIGEVVESEERQLEWCWIKSTDVALFDFLSPFGVEIVNKDKFAGTRPEL